jgi:hypothetical protein
MWTRRRILAFWPFIAVFLLASYVIFRVLAPRGDDRGASSTPHPSITADDCGRALRQRGTEILDAITSPAPTVSPR